MPEPHSIRITSGGKIKLWVKFALEFFEKEENSNEPLVFHTLPSNIKSNDQDNPTGSKSSVNTSNVVNTIPRLVSVVEIIKREYMKLLELNHSTRLIGLHQYNQIGKLEDLGIFEGSIVEGTEDEQRQLELSMVLEGKSFPKQKQTPYMKITLCCSEIPELVNGATYQPPTKRRLSKSAKARSRKRQKKDEEQNKTAPQHT